MPPEPKKKVRSWMGVHSSQLCLFIVSFLIVGFAQPDWSTVVCILAASIGYALFWKAMLLSPTKKGRFFLAVLWFAGVEALHLNWFMADRYVGVFIYPFLAILFLGLGVQFGIISLFIKDPKEMGVLRILGVSGGWTVLEWSRLFLLSGFPWDPTGLVLSSTLWGVQLASVIGVYGLSFWVFFTNLFALKMFSSPTFGSVGICSIMIGIPYVFGFAHVAFHTHKMRLDETPPLSALVVQTSLDPEQKLPFNGSVPLSPVEQWTRIIQMLLPYKDSPIDLIVLSESVVPYGTDYPIYPMNTLEVTFDHFFDTVEFLPQASEGKVGNHFWGQSIANAFNADLVMGLEDHEFSESFSLVKAYNAAFLLRPFSNKKQRYEKRVLVPMGEYIPFEWCKKILIKYGITDSFLPGERAKVFLTKRTPIGISICYEEAYGHLMRESRQEGANLLVNLTNDGWYPLSRLAVVHFLHGRLRAVEGGVPLIRSCNTGVTCAVDALGRTVGMLDYECPDHCCTAGVLASFLPLYQFPTFYTLFGDLPVIIFSSVCFILSLVKRKYLMLSYLNISLLRKN